MVSIDVDDPTRAVLPIAVGRVLGLAARINPRPTQGATYPRFRWIDDGDSTCTASSMDDFDRGYTVPSMDDHDPTHAALPITVGPISGSAARINPRPTQGATYWRFRWIDVIRRTRRCQLPAVAIRNWRRG